MTDIEEQCRKDIARILRILLPIVFGFMAAALVVLSIVITVKSIMWLA